MRAPDVPWRRNTVWAPSRICCSVLPSRSGPWAARRAAALLAGPLLSVFDDRFVDRFVDCFGGCRVDRVNRFI
jgi:hypothetical protein